MGQPAAGFISAIDGETLTMKNYKKLNWQRTIIDHGLKMYPRHHDGPQDQGSF